jgi:hypothetical protein
MLKLTNIIIIVIIKGSSSNNNNNMVLRCTVFVLSLSYLLLCRNVDLQVSEYSLKAQHCHHICNCWLMNNRHVSYVIGSTVLKHLCKCRQYS